jgi:hypothetical protein
MLVRYILLQQRPLEGERAAENEGDEVLGPVFADVGRLLDKLAVLEHAIARHIRADVDVAEVGQRGVARRAHADQGAGLGVLLAEGGELERHLARQDAQVALHEVGGDAGGVPGVLARADDAPCLAGVVDRHHAAGTRAAHGLMHGQSPRVEGEARG